MSDISSLLVWTTGGLTQQGTDPAYPAEEEGQAPGITACCSLTKNQ